MALNPLSASFTSQIVVGGSVPQSGLTGGLGSSNTINKQQTYSSAIANTTAYGADEAYNLMVSLLPAATGNIDLTSFVDIAGQTVALARLKAYRFHLLGTGESSPNGTAGTACSSVDVGGAVSSAHTLNMQSNAKIRVSNASCMHYGDGAASGFVVNSGAKNLLMTNNDAVLAGNILVTLVGGST